MTEEPTLYSRVLAVLGKKDSDGEWLSLIDYVGKPCSSFESKDGEHVLYKFNRLGFLLTYDNSLNLFQSVAFQFRTRAVLDGAVKPFDGELYAGIKSTDNRNEVEQKIGIAPFYASDPEQRRTQCDAGSCDDGRDHWEKYDLPPYRFVFIFETSTGTIDMLGVSLTV